MAARIRSITALGVTYYVYPYEIATSPISGSDFPITSGGVYEALQNYAPAGDYVKKTGDTMSGPLAILSDDAGARYSISSSAELGAGAELDMYKNGFTYRHLTATYDTHFPEGKSGTQTFAFLSDTALYLPLAGGTVTGNMTVGGNLTVLGTTTTINTQTVSTKDNLIELASGRSSGLPLPTPVGLVALSYDGADSGALYFDADGTAWVGDVKLDDSGNILVGDAATTAQPILTRNDVAQLNDGAVLKWDGTHFRATTGGYAPQHVTLSVSGETLTINVVDD